MVSSGLFSSSLTSFGVRPFYHYFTLHIDHTLDGHARSQFTRNLHFLVSEFHSRITTIFQPKCNTTFGTSAHWMTSKNCSDLALALATMAFLPANFIFSRRCCSLTRTCKFRSIFIICRFEIFSFILVIWQPSHVPVFFIFLSHSSFLNYHHFVTACHLQHHKIWWNTQRYHSFSLIFWKKKTLNEMTANTNDYQMHFQIGSPKILLLLPNKLYLCFVSSFQETRDKFSINILIYLLRIRMKSVYAAHKTRNLLFWRENLPTLNCKQNQLDIYLRDFHQRSVSALNWCSLLCICVWHAHTIHYSSF